MNQPAWLAPLRWNRDGLIPVIAQDHESGEVLMLAWMNAQALQQTLTSGQAVYWSRSRNRLWHKGETSGHIQRIHEVRLDCDGDALLLRVEQIGGIACHTGRAHCFYQHFDAAQQQWVTVDPVLKTPAQIYGNGHDT